MRHKKNDKRMGTTSSHGRCNIANGVKSLIVKEKIKTSLKRAKELRKYAEKMITLAKKNDLHAIRRAESFLMLRYNYLTPKEKRNAKKGDLSSYNDDRKILKKLFEEYNKRFENRNGGYTRIKKTGFKKGDNTEMCIIEFLEN